MTHTTPLVDIIIPTYENELLTVNCFKSIKASTKKGTYRIIWVDNASENYKKAEAVLKNTDHLFLRLDKNEGFVGAVNMGLRVSRAPYVCLLNNDTVVTPRWAVKLIKHLKEDKALGIVGALTGPVILERYDSHHCISHPMFAHLGLPKFEDFIDFNKKLEARFKQETYEPDFVAFLCAIIKREVIEKVGLLDPNYAMGMWDDCDYNRSAKLLGYEVALALNTCIYHKGRSTFKVIQENEGLDLHALLKTNRKYLDHKWAEEDV